MSSAANIIVFGFFETAGLSANQKDSTIEIKPYLDSRKEQTDFLG